MAVSHSGAERAKLLSANKDKQNKGTAETSERKSIIFPNKTKKTGLFPVH